jgi:transcriptional regulator with AAA-type ATPase domain
MAGDAPFASDQEHEVLEAVARLATSNPFLPDRIAVEQKALGAAFQGYAAVWHMDGELRGINPNIEPLREIAERFAETLRERLANGARATTEQLRLYEGFVRYLFFYRYESEFTKLLEEGGSGRAKTRPLAFFDRFAADIDHFFKIRGVRFPLVPDPGRLLAWGFQIRRAFHHIYWQVIGSSMPIANLRAALWRSIFTHDIERYRRSLYEKMGDVPTLILGESGTGKELAAQALGLARYIPFDPSKKAFTADYASGYQPVNLSALSSSLIESELFGHRRGSFTGAVDDRAGWLEGCGALGTIFLDEIGELEGAVQVKLLRVLQSRVFQRIGETQPRRFEGKIVAATNRDLEVEMGEGRFREDLFYRLCSDVIRMPTLREQIADSPEALRELTFVMAVRAAGVDEAEALARDTLAFIRSKMPADYAWPGNVRELEQCVRSVLVQGSYSPPRRGRDDPTTQTAGIRDALLSGEATADELLREYATRVYARVGSYEAAARVLRLDRRTVKAKIDAELLAELGNP